MHGAEHGLGPSIQNGLAVCYLLLVVMNLGFAAYHLFISKNQQLTKIASICAGVFLLHALLYYPGIRSGLMLPESFRGFTTRLMGLYGGQAGPILYVGVSIAAFVAVLYYRKWFSEPSVAWSLLNVSLLVSGWSITDPEFRLIVTKEDNVPIVLLIFSVGFFTWFYLRMAVRNDQRLAAALLIMIHFWRVRKDGGISGPM